MTTAAPLPRDAAARILAHSAELQHAVRAANRRERVRHRVAAIKARARRRAWDDCLALEAQHALALPRWVRALRVLFGRAYASGGIAGLGR